MHGGHAPDLAHTIIAWLTCGSGDLGALTKVDYIYIGGNHVELLIPSSLASPPVSVLVMQSSSTTTLVYNTSQLSQLCNDYLAKDLNLKTDTPSASWITSYLEYIPAGKHGIVTLTLINLRNFIGESRRAGRTPGLLAHAPSQILFPLALLRACDTSLGMHMSSNVVELKTHITELACKDPAIVDYLANVTFRLGTQNNGQSTDAKASKSLARPAQPPRHIDPLYSLVQDVQAASAQPNARARSTASTATLDLPCGSEHGVQRLTRLAPPRQGIHFEVSSDRHPISPEVQQWEKPLNALRSEFETKLQAVGVGVDVKKFEKDLFSRYVK